MPGPVTELKTDWMVLGYWLEVKGAFFGFETAAGGQILRWEQGSHGRDNWCFSRASGGGPCSDLVITGDRVCPPRSKRRLLGDMYEKATSDFWQVKRSAK